MVRQADGLDADLVQLYLDDIGRHPLLTKEDEARLGQTVRLGTAAADELARAAPLDPERRADLEARLRKGWGAGEVFVKANLRLVVALAKRYASSGVPLLDLIQEGKIGLMRAVEWFDPEKGVQVLHLRRLVDPPGHRAWHRQHRAHHPPARPRQRPTPGPADRNVEAKALEKLRRGCNRGERDLLSA